jgi:hypothetical protein
VPPSAESTRKFCIEFHDELHSAESSINFFLNYMVCCGIRGVATLRYAAYRGVDFLNFRFRFFWQTIPLGPLNHGLKPF